MKFKPLLDRWKKDAAPARTAKEYPIRLDLDDAARLHALAELFPGQPIEVIITDLLRAGLDEIAAAMPYEMDRGYRLEYDATARMYHHTLPNARYDTFRHRDGRNRVLLARRNLPWPLAAIYLADWMALTIAREHARPKSLRPWFTGFAEGWRADPGLRRPISLGTAWRMTQACCPPII